MAFRIRPGAIMTTDARLAPINELIGKLRSGDLSARAVPAGVDDAIDSIIHELNAFADDLVMQYTPNAEAEERLNEAMEMLLAMSSLNFDKQAHVSERGNVFDALAGGLNMLGQELAATTVSRSYLSAVLDAMGESLLVVAPDGNVRTANRELCALLGRSVYEIVDHPMSEIVAPVEEHQGGLDLGALLKTGSLQNQPMTLRSADGIQIPVNVNLQVLHDSEGNVTGFIGTGRDMRKTNKILSELEGERAQLRQRNAQYTDVNNKLEARLLELHAAQQQLLDASRKAGMADVAVSVLHNVGNVLNSVNVSASIVTEKARKDN